jgi:hypothetical protein
MRKGQTVVLREIFTFAFGLALMVTISTIFADIIAPQVSKMSVDAQLRSVFTHINALITETDSLLEDTTTSASISNQLPSMLGRTQFRAYTNANELCVKTFGQYVLKLCGELRLNTSITGNYLSGTDILLNGFKNSSGRFIDFRNKQ